MNIALFAKLLLVGPALLATVALAACGGGDDLPANSPTLAPSAQPLESPTPTPAAPSSPAATATTAAPTPPKSDTTGCPDRFLVCDTAFALEAAFVKGDWQAVAKLFTGITVICPAPTAPNQGLLTFDESACLGRAKGDRVQAVVTGGFATETAAVLLQNLAATLAQLFPKPSGYALQAVGVPFRSECEECRQVVLADRAAGDTALIRIELAGPRWGGTWLLRGDAAFLLSQPDRIGERYTTYDATAARWSNFVVAKSSRKEYDATVAAGGDCLNVREMSARNAKVLICLPDGSPVLVTEYTPATVNDGITWIQVSVHRLDGARIVGWAAKEFVKPR